MLRKKNYLLFVSLFLIFVLYAGHALAGDREIPFLKTDPESQAHGYINIDHVGYDPTDRLLRVYVFSLRPDTLYRVWIVDRNTGKRTSAGLEGENSLKTNNGGAGHFVDHSTEFILGWNKLEISIDRGDAVDTDGANDTGVVLWAWMYQ